MKSDIIDFYKDTKNYYALYHNHKETMSWAGLVLYMVFCGLMVRYELPQQASAIIVITLTIFFLAITICVYFYIRNQLAMKDMASVSIAACMWILTELVQTDEEAIDVTYYMERCEYGDSNTQTSHALPKLLVNKRLDMNHKGQGFQSLTRLLIYSLLVFSALLALSILWWQWFG